MSSLKRIALAVPLGWEYTYLLTEGILQYQAERGGYLLRDFRFDDPTFVLPNHPPTWEGWNPCGVLCAVGSEPGLANWLLSAGLPIVNMTADVDPNLMPTVHGIGGGILALNHLVSLGFRHLAHVGFKGVLGSELRFASLSSELRKLKLEPLRYDLQTDPVGSLDSRIKEAAAEPGLLQFLKEAPKPLGIVALNDDFARCICLACATLHISIPDEIAVVGVDDSSAARLCDPPLTTVRAPGRAVGYAAMKRLDSMLHGAPPSHQLQVFPCQEIVIRQSTQRIKDDSTERAMRMIENEACQGLTVGDLVRHLSVSRSYLEKQFVQQYGVTPGHKIRNITLQRAKTLLLQTELSITRISAMLGYSRNSVFSAFFLKCEGLSPSDYRRNRGKPTKSSKA